MELLIFCGPARSQSQNTWRYILLTNRISVFSTEAQGEQYIAKPEAEQKKHILRAKKVEFNSVSCVRGILILKLVAGAPTHTARRHTVAIQKTQLRAVYSAP
jgi:hypothetical protein